MNFVKCSCGVQPFFVVFIPQTKDLISSFTELTKFTNTLKKTSQQPVAKWEGLKMHNFAWSDLLSWFKLTGNLFPSPSLRVSNVSRLNLHCTIDCSWQTFVIDALGWWLVCLVLDHTVSFFGSSLMGHFVQMQYFACLPVETCLVDQLHWSMALLLTL